MRTPPTKGMQENLTGEGGGGGVVNVSRDSDGTGILNLHLHPRSRVTFINVSIVLENCYAFSNFIILSNCSPLTTFILSFQEQPTTVFSKISVRRSKYCLEFSINWGRLKVSRWPFPIHGQFLKLILLFSYAFLKFNFLHFTSQVRLIFVQKGNLKFTDSKM